MIPSMSSAVAPICRPNFDTPDAWKMPMFPGPISRTTDSGPIDSIASIRPSATSVSAASQEIRFHLPEPRGPTRLSGYLIRSAPYITALKEAPFWQPRGFMSGTPASTTG
jgi:hypothetical protein